MPHIDPEGHLLATKQVPVYLVDLGGREMFCVGVARPRYEKIERLYMDCVGVHATVYNFGGNCAKVGEHYGISKYFPDITYSTSSILQPATADLSTPSDETCAWVPYGLNRLNEDEEAMKRLAVMSAHDANKIPFDFEVPTHDNNRMTNLILTALVNMLGGGRIELDVYDIANAQKALDAGMVKISAVADPQKVIIEIEEL